MMASFLAGTITTAALADHGPDVLDLLAEARMEARSLDQLAFQMRDPQLRGVLHAHATRLDGQLAAVEGALAPRGPCVVDDRELAGMIGALRAEPFGDDRLALLRDVAGGRRFTTAQVARVVAAFTFDSEKIDAAAMLYPAVVDPAAFWTIYGGLTFSSSKEELRRRIGR